MFETPTTAAERYGEYMRLRAKARKIKKTSHRFMGFFLAKDTKAYLHLLKMREKKLYKEMKDDCYRCLGTGAPFAHQGDTIFYADGCPECDRNNPHYF